MNSRSFGAVLVIASCLGTACAQEKPARFDLGTTVPAPDLPKLPKWEIPADDGLRPIRLGKSDYILTGPLIDTFRPRPRDDAPRTLGRKILDLPIINMLVPAPWPKPTRRGQYFAWGERDIPWSRRPNGSGPDPAVCS